MAKFNFNYVRKDLNNNKNLLLLIYLLCKIDLVLTMSLVNHCKTDDDCPPSWNKNAIFCSTPVLNLHNNYYRRSDSEMVVYDSSQEINVDVNKPETLSHSKYHPVCVSYRPIGYKCEKRLDCLANKNVDLPYIQCVNGTCTDLGKTTGDYMKNVRGNHKKNIKYWYIGLGIGIVVVVLLIGCYSLMVVSKKRKIIKKKMERKIMEENKKNIYEDADKTYEDNYGNGNNHKSDWDKSVVVESETNHNLKVQPDKEFKNISNKEGNKKKNKRSLLYYLTLGLLGRFSSEDSNSELSQYSENIDQDATLGRNKTNEIKVNQTDIVNEIDLADSLKIRNISSYETLNNEKSKNHKELKSKNTKPILKQKSSIDHEKTLNYGLNRKISKATLGTLTTMRTLTSKISQNQSEKSTVVSTLVDGDNKKNKTINESSYTDSTLIRQSISSSVIRNHGVNDNENERSIFTDINQNNYDLLNNLSSSYQEENEIPYSDTSFEKNMNDAMNKRYSDRITYQNELNRSLMHFTSSDAINLRNNETFIKNNDQKSQTLPFKNKGKKVYNSSKQNPNNSNQIIENQNQDMNIDVFSTPNSTPEISTIEMNNSNISINRDDTYDYYSNTYKMNNHTTFPNLKTLPINEIIESAFGESSNSSETSSDDYRTNEINNYNNVTSNYSDANINNGIVQNTGKNNEKYCINNRSYLNSIPTPPCSSPHEFSQPKKDTSSKAKPFTIQQSNKSIGNGSIKVTSNPKQVINENVNNNYIYPYQYVSSQSKSHIQNQPRFYNTDSMNMNMQMINNRNYISSSPIINNNNNNTYSSNNQFTNLIINQNNKDGPNLGNDRTTNIQNQRVIIENEILNQYKRQQIKENQNKILRQFINEVVVPNTTNTPIYPVKNARSSNRNEINYPKFK
jgi:hypothetical protein